MRFIFFTEMFTAIMLHIIELKTGNNATHAIKLQTAYVRYITPLI